MDVDRTRLQGPCRLVVALLLLVSILPGLTGRAAAAAEVPAGRPEVGVQFHGTWSTYTDAQRLAVLDRLAAAGVEWIRLDLGWSSYEEQCSGCLSQWYVDRADRVIDAARARGLKVLAQVARTPGWASGGLGTSAPPQDPAEFGRFMGWLGQHLRGRVQAYELWNEPNLAEFWTGTTEQFVTLTHAGYAALQRVDPGPPVVLGGVSYNDTAWLDRAYAAGLGGSFDVMSTHPYMAPSDQGPEVQDVTGTNKYLLTHVAAVRDLMVRRGDGDKPIWFTEFGWSSHANTGAEGNWERGVTEAQQADYLVRTIDLVAAEYPYVTNVFWYTERNRGTSSSQIDNYGLLRNDLTPKPAYWALQQRLAAPPSPSVPRLAPASDTGSSAGDRITSSSTVTVSGTAPAGTTVGLLVGGASVGTAAVVDGTYTGTVRLAGDGLHSVTAVATGADGRTSPPSPALVVTRDATAPVVGAPTTRVAAGMAVAVDGRVPVSTSWPAVQDDVVATTVQESRDGGVSWVDVVPVATTATSATALSATDVSVLRRVSATDRAGNTGHSAVAGATATQVQETSPEVTLAGTGWVTELSASASAGRLVHAAKSGPRAVLTFTGTSVAWVGGSTPARGKADVLVDGVRVATVDAYAPSAQPRTVLFSTTVAPGTHRLEVRPLGSKRGAATDRRVDVDGFVVLR